MEELYGLLADPERVASDWRAKREEALALHHSHVDEGSAARAVALTAALAGLTVADQAAPLRR